jgi:hypothetical protein
LPDAPIVALRLDPPAHGGTLTITQMQIVDRRGHEIRRFTRNMFIPLYQIAAIALVSNGWNITSTLDGIEPKTDIAVVTPILSAGMNSRNLQRCILSTGYLALMLWILLLALLLTFHRPPNTKSVLTRICFMAVLALLFSLAGNRRLIRDAIHYALFVHAALQAAPAAPSPTAQSRIVEPTDMPLPDDVKIPRFNALTVLRQDMFELKSAERKVDLSGRVPRDLKRWTNCES